MSARLHEIPRSTTTRTICLHGRTGHTTEDQMCIAVNTTWINTGVTPEDISLPRLCISQTQQGQQTYMDSSTSPATAPGGTPALQPPIITNQTPIRYQARLQDGPHTPVTTNPRNRARGLPVGQWRMHQLRQRRTDKPREYRGIPPVHRNS